ncbi:carbohydrate binding protein with CBM9 domain [Pedobacter psychrotolerans]|uniref:Carbohydrate binding protein with CBM9 domain n=1 Tax=Pedobacter psychrotolerans TaxID=1843235 RepID=A0A4R2HG35_9SPHI|nr:DUF5916 domain-containing protein [Pedobacter psychrotolerans]TCO27037.1 carbohydrate binding protein with CBM9 domain [Pedobacter psychrotolerans]GGE58453.1 hypothetical protein GCM10011413_26110 [Pedobacter psychrotolerans]
MKRWLTFFLLLIYSICSAQDIAKQRQLPALRTITSPKIDGILDDACWIDVPIASDFIQIRPNPGKIETQDRRTEMKVLYDDVAIYVYARMYDHPDSVSHELVSRDQIGNADFISIILDPFYDKMNGNGFFVTAAGVQFDAKYSQVGDEDSNWNAVWESAVKLDDKGWTCEMKIPYSALRFSGKDIQNWGINFSRRIQRTNAQSFWNFVDPKVNGFINQEGLFTGLKDLKPPLRLSFSPYVSGYINHYPANLPGIKNTTSRFNGGMDVKYGINNSFTLDMTLVPDFGQVQSDNRILNLTPFEVKFNENRQFFTEGTELFNKGDLFYSKRIGSIPAYYNYSAIGETDKVIKDQTEAKVLNATKISGRTAKGLGIGIFNAITNSMQTEVEDAQGNFREVETQPLTNYNILVFDQSLKNNSSATFINTNVLRQGSAYDANVTALLLNLNNKGNKYFINGNGKMSYLRGEETSTGYSYTLRFGKQSGNFTWSYNQVYADDQFDPSDMGFFTNNNFLDQRVGLGYNIFKPGKWYNEWQNWFNMTYSRRATPGDYQSLGIETGSYVRFKNLWSAELDVNYDAKANNFYEARNGQIYKAPENYTIGLYINPNRAKAYNFGGNIRYQEQQLFKGKSYNFYLFQNFRLNDKVAFGLDLSFNPNYDFVNWVTTQGSQSIFSKYDRRTVENSFDAKYTFTNLMGVTVVFRHYWSDRRNKDFYLLKPDGNLTDYQGPALTALDRNYNVFNIDLIYIWQFAPGSTLSVSYKDAAETSDPFYRQRYNKNLSGILNAPQNNSLSVKVLYFVDYLDLKKKRKKA